MQRSKFSQVQTDSCTCWNAGCRLGRVAEEPEEVLTPEGQPLSLGRGYKPEGVGPQIAQEGAAVTLGGSYAPSREQQGLPGRDEVIVDGERLKLQAGYATRGNNPCGPLLRLHQHADA